MLLMGINANHDLKKNDMFGHQSGQEKKFVHLNCQILHVDRFVCLKNSQKRLYVILRCVCWTQVHENSKHFELMALDKRYLIETNQNNEVTLYSDHSYNYKEKHINDNF